MTTTIEINRPWVHGELKITRMDESRVRVQAFGLSINTVPVNIESVLVRGRFDEWSTESFEMQRVSKNWNGRGGYWSTSRRNQAKAREVVLDVVSQWAGAPPCPKPQPMIVTGGDDGLLASLLA